MKDKPESCYASGCLLAVTCRHCKEKLEDHKEASACPDGQHTFESLSKGFVLGTGSPRNARYAFILEAPGREETSFALRAVKDRAFFATEKEVNEERNERRRAYPEMDPKFIESGAPVVGPSGSQLQYQAWPKSGISRSEVFLDNTIRCLPPKSKQGAAYPTGAIKTSAELCCRQYDRLDEFRPDTLVFSLHPAGLLREITPLPLQVKDMEKIRDFATQGRRVIGLLGGKAVQAFARFGANVTKWRGHYVNVGPEWVKKYKERFIAKAKAGKKKKEESDDEFFPSSLETRVRRAARHARPSELAVEACKSYKRYLGKRAPRCGCAPCWDRFEEKNKP